jgi:hypothetical protein
MSEFSVDPLGSSAQAGALPPLEPDLPPNVTPADMASSVTQNPEAVAVAKDAATLPPADAAAVVEGATSGLSADERRDVYAEVVTKLPPGQVVGIALEIKDPNELVELGDAANNWGKLELSMAIATMISQVLWVPSSNGLRSGSMVFESKSGWDVVAENTRDAEKRADKHQEQEQITDQSLAGQRSRDAANQATLLEQIDQRRAYA